ncbi:DUF4177 domain-containing protein [Spirosoma montaniterrae]|uniref:DUF4177 domain-containing protein n=1 Tax=Spirosoma montaniterrae TaxID=1178516 RepID=A0A1P9WRY8_9BACT|nr:DUF4177 domain-containing protein [Spirosoma montaniterrae]AQG78141.1 hypothetical protein AWR27_01505 [Spirosoma montaniterrae]
MKRFEYRIIDITAKGWLGGKVDAQDLTDKLNEMGREGWEVVSVVDTEVYGGGSRGLLVTLKREI